MTAAPIAPIAGLAATDVTATIPVTPATRAGSPTTFPSMLLDGIDHVNQQLLNADKVSTAFALDDSIPVHQVTYALEQARLSFELMLQVRTKLTESYQEFTRMQL